jgi:hypothetical protein
VRSRGPVRIFLCYRREDSQDVTGRIFDRLAQQFGESAVFKDVDSIPPGVDYRELLVDVIGDCSVMLVIIGRLWLQPNDPSGRRRVDNVDDFVRMEIETAFSSGVPIIPILVGHASIPRARDLPGTLARLAYIQSSQIRPDPDFRRDMDRLCEAIRPILPTRTSIGWDFLKGISERFRSPQERPDSDQVFTETSRASRKTPVVVVAALLAAGAGVYITWNERPGFIDTAAAPALASMGVNTLVADRAALDSEKQPAPVEPVVLKENDAGLVPAPAPPVSARAAPVSAMAVTPVPKPAKKKPAPPRQETTSEGLTPEQKAEMRAHYERATRAYDIQKYDEAIDEYQKAYEVSGDPPMLYNIAQAFRLSDRPAEAIRYYRRYLQRAPDTRVRDDVERKIANLQALIDAQKDAG